jgi:phosphoglycolate phosphatase
MQPTYSQYANYKINSIFLDLDGPLLDGKLRHYECYKNILLENNCIPISLNDYWSLKRNRVNRKILLEKSNAIDIYDVFLSKWIERIETKDYLSLDRLQPKVVDMLSFWKSKGVNIFLITHRNNTENLHWQLNKSGLVGFFNQILDVPTLGEEAKSKSEHIRNCFPDLSPGECLWIGDTEADILSAQELKIRVYALSCGLRTREYLLSLHPDFIAEYLYEVEGV